MISQNTTVSLSRQDIRILKDQLYQLRPCVVINGSGLDTWAVQNIDMALESNELIKIRTHASNRDELLKIANEICSSLKATLIQVVGYIIAIYRKNPELEEIQ